MKIPNTMRKSMSRFFFSRATSRDSNGAGDANGAASNGGVGIEPLWVLCKPGASYKVITSSDSLVPGVYNRQHRSVLIYSVVKLQLVLKGCKLTSWS